MKNFIVALDALRLKLKHPIAQGIQIREAGKIATDDNNHSVRSTDQGNICFVKTFTPQTFLLEVV